MLAAGRAQQPWLYYIGGTPPGDRKERNSSSYDGLFSTWTFLNGAHREVKNFLFGTLVGSEFRFPMLALQFFLKMAKSLRITWNESKLDLFSLSINCIWAPETLLVAFQSCIYELLQVQTVKVVSISLDRCSAMRAKYVRDEYDSFPFLFFILFEEVKEYTRRWYRLVQHNIYQIEV